VPPTDRYRKTKMTREGQGVGGTFNRFGLPKKHVYGKTANLGGGGGGDDLGYRWKNSVGTWGGNLWGRGKVGCLWTMNTLSTITWESIEEKT